MRSWRPALIRSPRYMKVTLGSYVRRLFFNKRTLSGDVPSVLAIVSRSKQSRHRVVDTGECVENRGLLNRLGHVLRRCAARIISITFLPAKRDGVQHLVISSRYSVFVAPQRR